LLQSGVKLVLRSDPISVLLASDSVDDDWHEAVVDATQLAALSEESPSTIDV